MTCSDDVLSAFERLERRYGREAFDLSDVPQEVQSGGSTYKESTIRTHVTSRMCSDATDNRGTTYADLDRVERGRYRRQ